MKSSTDKQESGTSWLCGLAIFVFTIRGLAGFWTDYLWFDSLALSPVWTSVLWAKIGLGLLFTAIFFIALWLNLFIADRLALTVRYPDQKTNYQAVAAVHRKTFLSGA